MASTTIASIRKNQAPAMRDLRNVRRLAKNGYVALDVLLRAIRELDAATKRRRV
jgi:hypothetical protein